MSLKLLYDDFYKKVLHINIDNFNYTKLSTTIKLTDDVYFLPKNIQTYIESNLKTVYRINYKYKDIIIKLDYNTNKTISNNFFKELLYRIIFLRQANSLSFNSPSTHAAAASVLPRAILKAGNAIFFFTG